MEIKIEDFKKVEIKIGKVVECEKVEGADKLLRLKVDFGEFQRQILSGIAQWHTPDELIGKQLPFIINLEPRMLRGLESQGMLLAVDPGSNSDEHSAVLLEPQKEVPLGSTVV
jgi:methionine--tRNA ligase beta chain